MLIRRDTYLDVDDNKHDDHCRNQVAQVRRTLPLEGLHHAVNRVGLGEDEVEQGDDGTLELSSLVSADGDGREGLPHDGLADVGSNEERDATSEAVALLQELVEHQHHETGDKKLSNNQSGAEQAELANRSVHARQEVGEGFTEGDQETEEFLRGLEQLAVLLALHVDVDHLGADEQLHDHARGNDGRHTQLHDGTLV